MADHSEPEYFKKAREQGQIVVKDPPKFDLDAYIANYRGRTRFDRLFLIGTSSLFLYPDALKQAVVEAKGALDVVHYELAVAKLHEILSEDRDGFPDLAWVDKTNKQVQVQTDRLEREYKGYKNNLIKESIRMGCDDLGQHYHKIGDLTNATKSYNRMREHCTMQSHINIMKFRTMTVAIHQQNWISVQTAVQTIRQSGHKTADVEKMSAKLCAAAGLASLASGNFKEAAREFLNTDPRMVGAKMDDPVDEESYNEVMTPNDIAVYGGLCALASMSREQLQARVLENASFRNYLELEPHVRRAISFFVSSKYSSCLEILESYKSDYLLDIYLQRHLETIYSEIRTKAICQYFIPFSHVTISAMATAFATDEDTFENELTSMIKKDQLDARIDLVNRVLLARKPNPRNKVHADALTMAREYERTAHLRILRMEMLNAGLEVYKGKKKNQDDGGWLGGPQDGSFGNGMAGDVPGKSLRSGLRNG